ncbi:MAG: VOC family protein [Dehalococcoidia bacterium]|nr:VOC family protein [Dehalococcoidia bacterium]
MPNPVVRFEIGAKDAKKAQKFYADLFGWHVDANNPMNYGVVDTHAKGGINGGITAIQKGMPALIIYVEVDDLSAYLKKAEKLGGKTLMPPTVIPNMVTFALFADPQGTTIGMIKSDHPSAEAKPKAAAPARKAAASSRTTKAAASSRTTKAAASSRTTKAAKR